MRPDSQNRPPTAQGGDGNADNQGGEWLKRANEAYEASTTYMDLNFRKQWEDGIRAFNNQHPTDSKYTSPAYAKRSTLFRPKTRSVIRKNEAAAAAAFFSNMDTVSITAQDETSKAQLASADIMSALLHYRLTKSVPWFLYVMGGIQDAQVTGTVCGHVYWDAKYKIQQVSAPVEPTAEEEEDPEYPRQPQLPAGAFTMDGQNEPEVPPMVPQAVAKPVLTALVDKPCMDLVPVENVRIDPAANWMDPVNSSPYFIHLIPMYVMDVLEKIESGEWLEVSTQQLNAAASAKYDSTRQARQKDRTDPQNSDTRAYRDIDIVWVRRNFQRKGGQDWVFYTLDEFALLSEPQRIEEAIFHGQRPYVLGTFILEAHKAFSSGVPQISKGLQDEANEVANQRIDNVKFALNKKWFAKRGKEVDVSGLVRNVPGGVVMMDDPTNDVREISWPDVTSSAYEEQNRINLDMDELLGNFNPAALMMAGGNNAPARNMAMLSQSNGTLVEYGIRVFVETFIQPSLRLLIKCEQKYETDRTVLAIAANQAQLFQRYGMDEVTDQLLNQELTLIVNVGMGATDPTQKLNKFLAAVNSYAQIMRSQIPGLNAPEVGKEIFNHLGYRNVARFFSQDPAVAQMQQMIQQLQQQIQEQDKQLKEKTSAQVIGLIKTRETNAAKIEGIQIQEKNENLRSLATHITSVMSEAHRPAPAPKKAA